MTIDEFLINHLRPEAFDQPNFFFWVRTVIDAMALLGPETDEKVERLSKLLLDYHAGADIAPETIEGIPGEINRLGVDTSARNTTPLGLKYRCMWNLASSRERNLADLYDWQYGVVTAFQNINLRHDKDFALIALIRENASKHGANLYEKSDGE